MGRAIKHREPSIDVHVNVPAQLLPALTMYCERHALSRTQVLMRGLVALLEVDEIVRPMSWHPPARPPF